MAQNIITYDFQYPAIIITIAAAAAAAAATTNTTQQRTTYCETRAGRSLYYTHTHNHTHYTPDFSRHRKELSRSREIRKDSPNTPSSQSFKSQFPRSKYLSSPFTYFTVLSVRLRGKEQPGGSPAFWGSLFNFSHIFSPFHFSSCLSLILLICTFLGQTFLTGVSI